MRGCVCAHVMHGRSRMTINPRRGGGGRGKGHTNNNIQRVERELLVSNMVRLQHPPQSVLPGKLPGTTMSLYKQRLHFSIQSQRSLYIKTGRWPTPNNVKVFSEVSEREKESLPKNIIISIVIVIDMLDTIAVAPVCR